MENNNYYKGKNKNISKNRFYRMWAVLIALILLLSGCITPWAEDKSNNGTNVQGETNRQNKAPEQNENGEAPLTDTLTVHFLDVGQGDCILITCGNHAMLIDAGGNSMGTTVELYLKKQNIEKLDYVIGTHPDADHIGGLDVVIYKFECDTIILPDFEKNTATYRDVIDTIDNKGYRITRPEVGKTYNLGQAEFTIVSPVSDDYGDDANNYSVGIRLVYGDTSFLLAGDAEEEAEEDMLLSGQNLKADVFKASHHGSRTSNTEEFLEAVNPQYAVISCGENNSYGHPHSQTLNTFRAMGIKVFRTDEQGTIIIKSDGKELTFNCSPSESWKAGN